VRRTDVGLRQESTLASALTTRSIPRIGNAVIPKMTVEQTVEIFRTTVPSLEERAVGPLITCVEQGDRAPAAAD